MSIEDISFPDDDFEISRWIDSCATNQSLKNNSSLQSLENAMNRNGSVNAEAHSKGTPNDTTNQNESNQSSLGSMSTSGSSGKTNASERKKDKANTSEFSLKVPKKAISYQDIHSEYTKRRYKHVQSKVGKYIANMKALDQKRRDPGNLLTHRSLPETLSIDDTNGSQQFNNLRHSVDDIDYGNCAPDGSKLTDEQNGKANADVICLDKAYYEQLLKDKERKDYLQNKLEEKNTENWRLKQNLDAIRLQLSQCQDKLKQKAQSLKYDGTYNGNMNAVGALVKYTLPSLLHPIGNPTKSTQTEITLTPSPILTLPQCIPTKIMANTPMTPEFQDNHHQPVIEPQAPAALKLTKTVATIQPISLNFSNLLEQTERDYNDNTIISMENKSTPATAYANPNTNSNTIHSNITPITNHNGTNNELETVRETIQTQTAPVFQSNSHRQHCTIALGKYSQCCTICEKSYICTCHKNTVKNGGKLTLSTGEGKRCKRCKQHTATRHRMLHLLSACISCKKLRSKDLNVSSNEQKSSYSNIPLLQTSFVNH